MRTKSLEEAINIVFNKTLTNRTHIFAQEAMIGRVATEYDYLGKIGRKETYKKIVEDFKRRTGCYGVNHPNTFMNVGSILDIGCGSGLLDLELAEQTNGNIIGLDLSEDMINLAKKNLKEQSQTEIKKIKEFWEKIPKELWEKIPKKYEPKQQEYEKLEQNPPLLDRIKFIRRSAYDLQNINLSNLNYIICRNALHRFQYPERALKQMYEIISPNGKIYIRDLKRDADWQVILERIGEKRWNSRTLVKDYIGAMASMFTITELEKKLHSLNITNFEITNGKYITGEINSPRNIKEFEKDTEYVCVIKK